MYLCVCVCWAPCESSSEKKKTRDLEMCQGLLRGQKIIFKKNKLKKPFDSTCCPTFGVPAWEKQDADKQVKGWVGPDSERT